LPPSIPPSVRACPTEEELFAYVVGRAPRHQDPERILGHLDDCETCRRLIAEASRAAQGGSPTQPSTPQHQRDGMRTFADGQLLVDRYRILRFLARGGMGEVYLAEDRLLEEKVALKTLTSTALDDPRAAVRFKAEARLARRVTHPNICRILEFGIQVCTRADGLPESIPFLTMEFLIGETLAQRLARRGRLPAREAVPLLRQVIAGLRAIHESGIVHRDLKSENVFLVPDPRARERVVVMDFGLARAVDGSVVSTWPLARVFAGTIDTMAPEQLEGRAFGPAVDIFAFGVLAFEALAGRRPFVNVPPLQRLRQRAPAPSLYAPDLHRSWDAIIGRCLELDPRARFPSLEDLDATLIQSLPQLLSAG
jgi:serine/threonine protein kinase